MTRGQVKVKMSPLLSGRAKRSCTDLEGKGKKNLCREGPVANNMPFTNLGNSRMSLAQPLLTLSGNKQTFWGGRGE